MNDWYEIVVPTKELAQGDILFKCPVFLPDPDVNYDQIEIPAEVNFTLKFIDVVVMTQSCDLSNNDPVDSVILCPLASLKGITTGQMESIRKNQATGFHLLDKFEGEVSINYRVVDFTTIYSVPFLLLNNWKNSQGKRLRLSAPFREQMSQRFGLHFMRVGHDSEIDQDDLKAARRQKNP